MTTSGNGHGVLASAALMGTGLAEVAAEFLQDTAAGTAFCPRNLLGTAMRTAAISAQGLSGLLPDSMNRQTWQELANKIVAWHGFAYADTYWPPNTGVQGLASVIQRVEAVEAYSRMWTMEGLGYHYAQLALRADPHPQNLLTADSLGGLPPNCLLPLHTGTGLALAEEALRRAGAAGLRAALDQLHQSCTLNTGASYAEVVFEPLGLVAVTIYPNLVAEIGRELGSFGGGLAAYYWHGAGRGLYFTPFHFVPGASARRRAIAAALSIPDTLEGQQNAMAGLAWAMALVNVRQPEILDHILRVHQEQIQLSDAFANGVRSAMKVWHSLRLGNSQPRQFVSTLDEPGFGTRWSSLFRFPAEAD
jgi:hypothetical protein